MRSVRTIIVVVLLALCASTLMAQANDHYEMGKKFTVSGGVFFPIKDDLRDDFGSLWWDVRVGYILGEDSSSRLILDVGWIEAEGETLQGTATDDTPSVPDGELSSTRNLIDPGLIGSTSGTIETDARIIPVTLTYKTSPQAGANYFYSSGVGLYFTKTEATTTTGTISDTSTEFGFHSTFGWMFTDSLSAQIRYSQILDSDWGGGVTLSLVGTF